MIKMIGLLKKKPGISTKDFRSYYEDHHAPLAKRLLLAGADYRRNYPNAVRIEGKEVEGEPDFDVVTEVCFPDQAAYDSFSAAMQYPENRSAIVEDEKQFIDRAASRIMIVEEHRSEES